VLRSGCASRHRPVRLGTARRRRSPKRPPPSRPFVRYSYTMQARGGVPRCTRAAHALRASRLRARR
jgi:hypothetical protein